MGPRTTLVLAGARFETRADAVAAYENLWASRNRRAFRHMFLAVLTKDATGSLHIDRHNTSTERAARRGAVLGAALVAAAPPAGATAVAAAGGLGGGVGAIVGYFWRALPKGRVKDLGELLDSGESGLVLVGTKLADADIESLLPNALRCVVIETKADEFDRSFSDAIEQAAREKHERHEMHAKVAS